MAEWRTSGPCVWTAPALRFGNKPSEGLVMTGPGACSRPRMEDFSSEVARALPQTASELRQNGFRFFLSGATSNAYRSEYSSNGMTWFPLQTNIATAGEIAVLDRGATNAPRRQYRARLLP